MAILLKEKNERDEKNCGDESKNYSQLNYKSRDRKRRDPAHFISLLAPLNVEKGDFLCVARTTFRRRRDNN